VAQMAQEQGKAREMGVEEQILEDGGSEQKGGSRDGILGRRVADFDAQREVP